MIFKDLMKWAWHYLKTKLFESLLIIIITTLGVGTIIILISYVGQTNQIVNSRNARYEQFIESDYLVDISNWGSIEDIAYYRIIGAVEESRWRTVYYSEYKDFKNLLPGGLLTFISENFCNSYSRVTSNNIELDGGDVYLYGRTSDYFIAANTVLEEGNFFLEEDVEKGSMVAIISQELSETLFGEKSPIGCEIKISGTFNNLTYSYEVIGLLASSDKADDKMNKYFYCPVSVVNGPNDGQWESPFGDVFIKGNPASSLSKEYEQIKECVRMVWGDDVDLISFRQKYVHEAKVDQMIAYLIVALSGMAIIIAMVNIMNLTLARVLKREKFIGLNIALGSTGGHIFSYFLIEAGILGTIGSLLGLGLSTIGLKLLANVFGSGYLLGISPGLLTAGFGAGILMTLLFSIYPAYFSLKLNPVDCLKNE